MAVTLAVGDVEVSALVPSGKSRGVREAVELRDEDGEGVSSALEKIRTVIAPLVIGRPPFQKEIDGLLIREDGTSDKSNLGGNSIIGVSLAVARLAARIKGVPLWKHIAEESGATSGFPRLFMNMINGGAHAGFRLPFQEYLVVINKDNPRQGYELGQRMFARIEERIRSEFGEIFLGDEGGFSPKIKNLKYPFEILSGAAEGEDDVSFGIDAAASNLKQGDRYELLGLFYSASELEALYENLTRALPLRSIEDPFAEDEIADFEKITGKLGPEVLVVGDDLTVTNPSRVREIISRKAANAVIIKPNQVGTLTETYEAVRLARGAGWEIIVSHRSGETKDAFIADLAVGLGAYGIKAGPPNPSERRAKYERLIEIAEKEMVTFTV